ncbi:phage portal protein [Methylobacterium sp. J-078]|uniref:phage portal protein n=1 Tax=Methylobacterium sp. J-078 TaxID=2836657 RepID=UPI001FB90A09|nr:phage portal protein [Methylobacterium sp. J-078]MCJ2044731.1 phage portal protein [Methylobacterium sp. J-078]
MGLWNRLFGVETRSGDVRLSDPYLGEFFGMQGRGGNVTPDAVLSNLAVAARCVALRSEMMASVGLYLFRRTDNGGRERADDNPLYGVLHDIANPNMTAFEAREFLVRSLDLTGNAYARIERNARGQVTALYPLAPLTVGVERLASGRLRYRVGQERGAPYVLLQEEMLHLRGPSRDGMLGQSPISISRGSLGLALTNHDTAASLSANSLRPSGILSFPERLTHEQRLQVRQSMEQRYVGTDKAGKLMVMDGGAKFERMAFSPEDAEFLDSRKLGNEDVARIFGLPPTSVGITDKATYSNTEQEGRALVQNALGPLAGRIEAAMIRCLLTDVSRRTLYVEHDLDTLLRGDVKARFEAYRIGRETGALSPNDIRRRENDPPIPNGDVYHQPANWVPLGTAAPAATVVEA